MIPGEIFAAPGDIVLNENRAAITLDVANAGDRPIQVGSHYHFAETNPALAFDRQLALGYRLDIPRGDGGALRAGPKPPGPVDPLCGRPADLRLLPEGDGRAAVGAGAMRFPFRPGR